MRIGVMALQGSFSLHVEVLTRIGVEPVEVRRAGDMINLSGIIIPGGESTTFQLILERTDLGSKLIQELEAGLPAWGTCAGAILLGRSQGKYSSGWGMIDVDVVPNAYGRQIDSFVSQLSINGFDAIFDGVFIRAPRIIATGKQVEVLTEHASDPVMVKQDNILITTFHPELTADSRIHHYFVEELCRRFSDSRLYIAS